MSQLKVLNARRGAKPGSEVINLLGHDIQIRHGDMLADIGTMQQQINSGYWDAVAVASGEQMTSSLAGDGIVDGSEVRDVLARCTITQINECKPRWLLGKRVLLAPGWQASTIPALLKSCGAKVRCADSTSRVVWLHRGHAQTAAMMNDRLLRWADVLIGDQAFFTRIHQATDKLRGKTVLVESLSSATAAELARGGVVKIISMMPDLGQSAADCDLSLLQACLCAIGKYRGIGAEADCYLNLIAQLDRAPIVLPLDFTQKPKKNVFSFIIHPLHATMINQADGYRWTRFLPNAVVEKTAAQLPPQYGAKITGIESPATGQQVEGHLVYLGATPRQLMTANVTSVYRRLVQASRLSAKLGARIMGLGAFTSVVGDAGKTVAEESDIAVTSGNSLTVAAALETAKQAAIAMGHDLSMAKQSTAMVIGATGSIGAVCSRLLAQSVATVILVAPRPEKLIALKKTIVAESPQVTVKISTRAASEAPTADFIITTTTAVGQRILDIRDCKPGAIICDIARPGDIAAEDAALRPDVLVVESGEVILPGKPNIGMDIGLPPGVAYACLAETALLALEGKFENYTIGRDIDMDKVKAIYRLYQKHGLKLSPLRSHGKELTATDFAEKRLLVERLLRRMNDAKVA